VLASGEDVNILVFDTEVLFQYRRPVVEIHPGGRHRQVRRRRQTDAQKDLGMMAVSYGNVYVAQVAMGPIKPRRCAPLPKPKPGRDRRW
jgi:pyruvate-ferredoxin/flavodoxin oxidoreductase